MTSDVASRLRRAPRQERSRAMVDRILDAGEQMLIAHGFDGASTNRIAAAAGISPGSLYQYFPNKDAIAAAVIDRFSDQLSARVAARVSERLDQPAPDYVRESIAALIEALDVHPEFLRAVMEQTPRLGTGSKLVAFEQRIGELTVAYLTINKRQVRTDVTVDVAAWMLVRMVEHLCVRYILDQPSIEREKFIDEVTLMALNYLRPWPTPPEDCFGSPR
ncbi:MULTISPECIES: TetR/AcrR family transcriptional regulator [Mycolicibacterium]|uniref:Transcriptional regulator, TetR family n=1 Tax=Mycolicibacterium vanbaalenii (strain DSM 7251 / JCM 13017 / BCRC 16820 / KCTC 9966 / NRRL B-24157 / PYR-1) TaxID=350058 RepID=A1T3P3_MYCVP|nr:MULTISPECIES: TetR/AcrR family transcriptional regulator [Mycolicibacterium]ABM11793.1 transcriptional regulator, TetR family [Mycolicibacterium vanbaalenii PYR-1]MCV7127909.1 TetR/AcrR family transcriptional regulator [Mycolicibacterium vanbaalenii PYR-1]MDW5611607.1 TetR/AcrR family transcriptional regulator [Mycolicibacterium sp. D5.8-2]UJL29299.1 TetR/AcrR family transcriptional regulator [Mycolicibacterium vanbaalenii]WND57674.1 TetR/AcrR family transcriptional regulator [Mycolicibacte